MDLKALHRYGGLLTVAVFLGTGIYMRLNFPDLYQGNEAVRHLFRANHIYILLAGLVNLALGLHLSSPEKKWRKTLQRAGSFLLLTAPAWLTAAFFREPPLASPARPLTVLGIYFLFAGVVFHGLSALDRPKA